MKKLLLGVLVFLCLLTTASARQDVFFPSTALTASAVGPDFIIDRENALHVLVTLSAYTGTGNFTATLQGKWPDSTYYTILAGTALAANGAQILRVGRGLTAAAGAVANDAIPPILRVIITLAGVSTGTIIVHGNFAN